MRIRISFPSPAHCWHSIYGEHARTDITASRAQTTTVHAYKIESDAISSSGITEYCMAVHSFAAHREQHRSMEHYYVAISRTRAQKLNCLIKFAFAIYLTDIVPTTIFSYTHSSLKWHMMRVQCIAGCLAVAVGMDNTVHGHGWRVVLYTYELQVWMNQWNERMKGNFREFISVRIV